jgi:hypothetical protein
LVTRFSCGLSSTGRIQRTCVGIRREDHARTSLSIRLSDQLSSFPARCADASCLDVDGDGLDDDWEDGAIDRLRPALQLHPEDPMLDHGREGMIAVARVAIAEDCPAELRVVIAFLFDEDPGRCGVARHHGDVEQLTYRLQATRDPLVWEVREIVGRAHEGTPFEEPVGLARGDRTGLAWPDPVTGEDRIPLLVAAGKHALYPAGPYTPCRDESFLCRVDRCSPDVFDPVVIETRNVGEADHPRPGPAHVEAWSTARYCGRHPPSPLLADCAPPIREKLGAREFFCQF